MTFVDEAKAAQIAWKQRSSTLDEEARLPGEYRHKEYDFCLPREFARFNLLPDARPITSYFEAAEIPWHDSVDGGPSNHLRDSQVQCVNALAPLANDSDLVIAVFGESSQMVKPLPMGDPAAPDAYVAFEWIGEGDPLGEHPNGKGTRGANNTSADAAFRYERSDGSEVLTLIEWKYTEQYLGETGLKTSSTAKETRDGRYRHLFDDPDGPLDHELIPYDDFYVEPVYQLLRLSLLASQLEKNGAADIVRLLYCAPARNAELWRSLNRPSHREASPDGNLGTLWQKMQRRPDRFQLFDTAQLVAPDAPTSTEFKARYGHIAGAAASSD